MGRQRFASVSPARKHDVSATENRKQTGNAGVPMSGRVLYPRAQKASYGGHDSGGALIPTRTGAGVWRPRGCRVNRRSAGPLRFEPRRDDATQGARRQRLEAASRELLISAATIEVCGRRDSVQMFGYEPVGCRGQVHLIAYAWVRVRPGELAAPDARSLTANTRSTDDVRTHHSYGRRHVGINVKYAGDHLLLFEASMRWVVHGLLLARTIEVPATLGSK